MFCGPYVSGPAWTPMTMTYEFLGDYTAPTTGGAPPAKLNKGFYWCGESSAHVFGHWIAAGDGTAWSGDVNVNFYLFRDPTKAWVLCLCIMFSDAGNPWWGQGNFWGNVYLTRSGTGVGPNGTYTYSGGSQVEYPTGRNNGGALEIFMEAWYGTTPPFANLPARGPYDTPTPDNTPGSIQVCGPN